MSELLEYKCPHCGGAVKFDASSQKLKCPYCDTEFDVGSLNQSNENQNDASEEAREEIFDKPDEISWDSDENSWQEGEQEGMMVYYCNSCGGEIMVDKSTAATSCPYCGNPVVIKGQLSGAMRPDLIIPFKIDKKAAKAALMKHVSSKKLVPKIFKDTNHIDEIKGVYVPYWLFTCDAYANILYNAENVRHWSDADYDYTETSYYEIYRSGNIGFNDIPVDGSSKMDDTLMESIEPFNLSEGVNFQTAYLSGYLADKYDVTVDASIPRANERLKNSASSAFRSTVNGYTAVSTKSSQINVSNGIYKYALYPVWILNTTWKDQKFTFAVNGQTGKIVGNLPLDKGAFWKWTALLGAGIGAIIYALLWLIMFL